MYRAWVALRAQLGGDVEGALAAWAALDPDHVRLSGVHDDREVPWAVVAPWTWAASCGARARDRRCAADAPRGADDVGTAWRAAAALPAAARLDTLAALQARSPTLHGLATERWRLAAPDPERPLDVPRSVE